MKLSTRVSQLEMSPTLAVMVAAKALKDRGVEVVDLGPGEPDFDTPAYVKAAAHRALDGGYTKYTDASGLRELRQAIADRYNRIWGSRYAVPEVIVTCGAKMALYEIAMAIVDPGDEVIIPSPYWVTFPEQVRLAGGTPVFVPAPASDGFVLRAEHLAPHVTSRTRALVLNTPNNPTGAVIPEAELRTIAALCKARGIAIVFDECYDAFVYEPEKHFCLAAMQAELGDLLVVCGSFSKTYAMTGHRLGYVLADRSIVSAMGKLQSHMTSNPTSFVQVGGREAFENVAASHASVTAMIAEYRVRRDLVLARLEAIPNVRTVVPMGAFYVFPDLSAYQRAPYATSVDLARYLLEEGHVAVVPGSAFGLEGYARLSYATSRENLEKGLAGMAQALAKIR
ncbi:MAG: pyridoxal phosphate-dependent aminotransferase [Acidobacteriota bacterium]